MNVYWILAPAMEFAVTQMLVMIVVVMPDMVLFIMIWTNAQLILARPMQIVEILKEALSAVAKLVSVVMAFSAQMMTNAPTEQLDVMKMLPVSTTVVFLPVHVIPTTMAMALTA